MNSKFEAMAARTPQEWQQPRGYDLSLREDSDSVAKLIEGHEIESIIDPVQGIAEDLFELHHPGLADDEGAKLEYVSDFSENSDEYGRWFHFPWRRSLVHYPTQEDNFALRTYRNKMLISGPEQEMLGSATIAVFGMSVGSNVVDSLVQAGVGERYVIADYDAVSPSNLNRIKATMADVGLQKTVVTGRRVSEVDPYIHQIHLSEGYTDATDDLLRATRPDVIIDEVDNLAAKAKLRRIAGRLAIPLVMVGDIGERSVLDVERYDREDVKPFNGKISQKMYEALLSGDLTRREQEKVLVQVNGIRNLSPRLIDSALRRGVDIAGFPQLGSTASAGSALATTAIRGILTGENMKSGTYVINPRKTLHLGAQESLASTAGILWRFSRRNHQ